MRIGGTKKIFKTISDRPCTLEVFLDLLMISLHLMISANFKDAFGEDHPPKSVIWKIISSLYDHYKGYKNGLC